MQGYDTSNWVLPASAGMILDLSAKEVLNQCAPRIRGDDPMLLFAYTRPRKCSPHPRG